MTRDFTLEKYSELVQVLKQNYTIMSVADYISSPKKEEFIAVLRHDVDKFPERATRMALLEKNLGIHSTYYFRWDPKLPGHADSSKAEMGNFPKQAIIETKLYGHEVGYHYENLSELRDKTKALADFETKLAILRKLAPVSTVAMHGAPRVRVRNADMLEGVDLSKYDLLGEPHLSPEFANIAYITDSGRMWSSGAGSVRDTMGKPLDEKVKNTDALIEIVKARKYPRLMVSARPGGEAMSFELNLANLLLPAIPIL
ncbi:MAG: hypothetical protein KKH41_02420 [Candidatus Thermoplasmatota archaeon]|nr:hypothetical protein [Candidatus Thermoplasmatota archaeon]MBU4591417.1 hypothetical protein [Candidatus Thermoplasmatota archaeon]